MRAKQELRWMGCGDGLYFVDHSWELDCQSQCYGKASYIQQMWIT